MLASVLLGCGMLAGSLSLSAAWTSRTLLDPSATDRVAIAVVNDPAARSAIVDPIAAALAPSIGRSEAEVRAEIEARIAEGGAAVRALAGLARRVHEVLLGGGGRIEILPSTLTDLVGPQLGARAPAITVDVPEVAALSTATTRVRAAVAPLVVTACGLIALALVVHPRRRRALRSIGVWLIGLSVWQLALWWVLPVVVLPRVVAGPVGAIAQAAARAESGSMVAALAVLAGAGAACIVASLLWRPVASIAAAGAGHDGSITSQHVASGARSAATASPASGALGAVPQVRPARFGRTHRRPASARDTNGDWLL